MNKIETLGFEETQMTPKRILYAGTSLRREIFLKTCFPNKPLMTFNIDPEPEIEDVQQVMKYKVNRVLSLTGIDEGDVIFAADTRTKVLTIGDGKVKFTAKGKPNSLGEIQNTFKLMAEAARVNDEAPYYSVEAASGALFKNHKEEFFSVHDTCSIILNKEKFLKLETNDGFSNYLQLFDEFYTSSPYERDGVKRLTPFNLSSGISLPVLMKMGMVESVHSIPVGSPIFKEVFKHAIQTVAVGVAVDLIDIFGGNGQTLISQWPWLNGVVEHSLSDR